jgi:hypothetical protein
MGAYCLVGMGKYWEVEHCGEKCLEIAHVYNNQQDIGVAYNILGMIGWTRGDYSSALFF